MRYVVLFVQKLFNIVQYNSQVFEEKLIYELINKFFKSQCNKMLKLLEHRFKYRKIRMKLLYIWNTKGQR